MSIEALSYESLMTAYQEQTRQLEAVVAERDALAAESCIQDFIITAVKDLVRDSEGVIGWHLNGDVASWDEVLPELSHSETPVTSAALAEVEAKAIEKAAKELFGCGYSFELLMRHAKVLREGRV